MAKHSMRGYYALGALVLGIILLYVIVRNVEPFQSQEIVYVYFNIDKFHKISSVTSSNQSIVSLNNSSSSTLSLKINPQYRLTATDIKKNISVDSISTRNCNLGTSKKISNTNLCIVNVSSRGKTQLSSKLSGNIFSISGIFSDENTGLPDVTIKSTNIPGSGMPPGANVRITLTLTKK